jgi:hypothetical protein
MIKLIFPGKTLEDLAEAFKRTDLESFALILARPAAVSEQHIRLLVQSVHVPGDCEYDVRSRTEVRPKAEFRLPLEKRARQERLSPYTLSQPSDAARRPNLQCDRHALRKAARRVRG